MTQFFGDFIKSYFPQREESTNGAAFWLDRAIYFFILLTVLAAPISIAATNIGWISGLAVWIVRLFVRPRPGFRRSPLDFPLMALFAWSLLTCFFSYAPDLSFDRLRVLTLFPIAYLISQNVRSAKTVKVLFGALALSCLVTVGWTFLERIPGRGVQVFGVREGSPLAWAQVKDGDTLLRINGKKFSTPEDLVRAAEQNQSVKLQFYRPDWYFDQEIQSQNLLPGATAEEKLGFSTWKRSRNWRSAAFYSHYTTYAEVLQLILSLVFGVFIALPEKRSRLGILLLVCVAAMSIALLMTATRASQVGFLVSALAVVTLAASRKTLLLLIIAFVPVAIAGAIYSQQSRNASQVDASDEWRKTVYREGLQLLTKSPRHMIVGVGIDSINRFRCEWGLFANCTLPPGHLHSTPLQIAVECGLPALFLWLFVVFRYGKTLLVSIRKRSGDWLEKGILLGAFGGLLGFFTSGAVHYNLGDSEVAIVFYIIMGFSLALTRIRSETIQLQ